MDSEDAKRMALDSLFKTIDVAKEHHKDLVEKIQTVYPGFDFDQYDVHHLPFLKITKSTEEADLGFIVEQLQKYFVLLSHMTQEEHLDEEYRHSLVQAKSNIDQLLNYTIFMAKVEMEEGDVVDEGGLPPLPDDLKSESSPSGRQRRDILTVRDYGNLLSFINNFFHSLIY